MVDYTGTPGADSYDGSQGDDVLFGGDGDDILRGRFGDDQIDGGDGNDKLYGGPDFDFLRGGDGDDVLAGGEGNDIMRGGAGVDRFNGGDGNDRVSFFESEATRGVYVDLQQGVLDDGFGNREMLVSVEGIGAGTVYADTFIGNEVGNFLWGGSGDRVFGLGGNDAIQMDGIRNARVDGGDGTDVLYFSGSETVLLPDGTREARTSDHGIRVDLERSLVVDDGFGASAQIAGIEGVLGSVFDDLLVGDDGANSLGGFLGNDRLFGGGGDDVIDGEFGSDKLVGGAGNDRLRGSLGDDIIRGDAGDDRIVGGSGFDRMIGGAGSDRYVFYDNDSDTTRGGADRIFDFSQTDTSADGSVTGDRIDFSNLALDGDGPFRFIGTAAFSGAGDEVRFEQVRGFTFIQVDNDATNPGADLVIRLESPVTLTADDFIL